MPGKDPGGAIGTLMLGITGCVIGGGMLVFFNPQRPASLPLARSVPVQ